MKPTFEQAEAISTVRSGSPLVLEAMAGTGKSSTLEEALEALGQVRHYAEAIELLITRWGQYPDLEKEKASKLEELMCLLRGHHARLQLMDLAAVAAV